MIVTYEVIIGIQRLIHVSGRDLSEPTWDVLCDILRTIADNIHYYGNLAFLHHRNQTQKLIGILTFQRKMMVSRRIA